MPCQNSGIDNPNSDTIRAAPSIACVAPHGGHDASRYANRRADQHAQQRQLERDRQSRQDQLGHRGRGPERRAQITHGDAADPLPELQRQWLIETEEVAQTLALAFGDRVLRPEHLVDHVAWNEAEQEEDEDRNTQQRWDDRQRAFQDVGVHTACVGRWPTSAGHARSSGRVCQGWLNDQ